MSRRHIVFSALLLPLLCGVAVAQQVGVTAAVNQSALGTAPSAAPRTLVLGDKVIHDERIITNDKGLLQILLADGTSFTVGPSSSLAIDSFVYDPAAGTAKVVATLGKGVFRFIGGKTSKTPDGVTLNTPVGTVGIRGGISDLDFSGHHGLPFHIDMLFGDSITLTGGNGQQLGHIFTQGYSIVVGGGHPPSVVKTPAGWTQSFQQGLAGSGGQHGGAPHGTSVTNTEVASALGGTNSGSTPPTQPGGTPGGTTSVADNSQPPPPFTPPDQDQPPPDQGPTGPALGPSQWPDINNSSLAGVEATYNGAYQFTTTYALDYGSHDDYSDTGDFSLTYDFGEANGGGVMTFGPPSQDTNGDGPISFPVSPDSTQNAGPATFSAYDDGAPDYDGVQNGDIGINGHFINTNQGVAHDVAGTFSGAGSGSYDDGDGLSPGTATTSGTFAGTQSPPP